MPYLYTPPTWNNPIPMGGALVVHGVPTSTLVYRQGGVWHNKFTAGIDDPVVASCDVDPSGLLLFFTTPTVVPNTLYAELSALTPADPSWSPGTLALIA